MKVQQLDIPLLLYRVLPFEMRSRLPLLLLATLGAAPARSEGGPGSSCYTEPGVEYLQPPHYKELKAVVTSDGCCAGK